MPTEGTVSACVRRYLAHLAVNSPASLASYRSQLKRFARRTRRLAVADLKVNHLTGWLDAQADWKPGSKCTAWGRVMMALSWNRSEGHIGVNPLAGAKRPARYQRSARGAECVLPPALARLLIGSATGRWRAFLLALARTGARPSELAYAVTENWCQPSHAILHRADESVLFRHKNAGRKKSGQRDRIIYLEGETEETVKANARRGGYLLPCDDGGPWTAVRRRTAWTALLASGAVARWLTNNGHCPSRVVPYSFRHSWITTALLRGTPLVVVATLAGTSAAMIERHYGHVGADRAAMRRAYLASL